MQMAPTLNVGSNDELSAQLAGMRHRLVDRVYWAAGVLALMYVPVLLWRVSEVGWHFQLKLHAAVIAVTVVLVPSLKRISLQLKSAILVSVFLLLGLLGVFTMGMVGTGYWWCLQGAVLVATLYSMRAGAIVALVCALLLLLSGAGFVSGEIALPFDMNAHVRNASAWAAFLVVVMFAPLALLLALGSYQATVERLVTQVSEQRQRLERQVGHDTLTGLPLMRLATDRLEVAVKQARRTGDKVALLFVDLDGFKAINDGHGHGAGDHVLQKVAHRLRHVVREADTVARAGGDEFVVLIGGIADPADAAQVAGNINAALARPIEWRGMALQVGASVGIALFPDHGDDAETLRRLADAAMYEVKRSGKNGFGFARDASIIARRA